MDVKTPSPTKDETLPPVVMPACPIDRKLTGQKALVTGASSGIGRGIAIGLGHAGADVVVNYRRDEAQAQAIVEEVKRCGGNRPMRIAPTSRRKTRSARCSRGWKPNWAASTSWSTTPASSRTRRSTS